MSRRTNDDWTPRARLLKGVRVYCSPRCGAGCTRVDYDNAHRAGGALARRLGHGWTVRVWENLGWHYEVISPCGRFEVHCHEARGRATACFSAGFGPPDGPGRRWFEDGATPEAAIWKVAQTAVLELHKLGALILDMPLQARLPKPPPLQISGKSTQLPGCYRR